MSHRVEKINQFIRRELSELLQRQVKDPRLGSFISVNEVDTSPDLKRAKVYVSQMGSDQKPKEIMTALAAASGFFRTELSRNMRTRVTPELDFFWDDSIERGSHLLDLINHVSPDKSRS